jgi:hypothetical protein
MPWIPEWLRRRTAPAAYGGVRIEDEMGEARHDMRSSIPGFVLKRQELGFDPWAGLGTQPAAVARHAASTPAPALVQARPPSQSDLTSNVPMGDPYLVPPFPVDLVQLRAPRQPDMTSKVPLGERPSYPDVIPPLPAYADRVGRRQDFEMGDGRDLNGDGIPDVVTRTVSRQLDDGATERTVEKYSGGMRPPTLARADRGMTDRLLAGDLSATDAQLVRRGLSPMNRDTGMARRAERALASARAAQSRADQLSEAAAGRQTMENVETIRGAATVGAKREEAKGLAAAEKEKALGLTAAEKEKALGLTAAEKERGQSAERVARETRAVQALKGTLYAMDDDELIELYHKLTKGDDAMTRIVFKQLQIPEETANQDAVREELKKQLEEQLRRRDLLMSAAARVELERRRAARGQ